MANTIYSHSFLVGSFNGELTHLGEWTQVILTKEQYEGMLSDYYKSHVDAMVEAEDQVRPPFLSDVHHYMISFQEKEKNEKGWEIIKKKGEIVHPHIKKGDVTLDYSFALCCLHLYLFPNGLNIVAIEIDDSGVELDTLTTAHRKLIDWKENIDTIADDKLKSLLTPLSKMLPDQQLSKLVTDGNNLKIYQIVQMNTNAPNDKLLFEIGTFSEIGSACGTTSNSLSQDYYDKLMKENAVSTYYNWKALALVDSFTVLGGKGFGTWQWENLYFPLIYMRCILEKTFCFSRNNSYRLGRKKGEGKTTKELSDEISDMEKYYFYSNFSYNFQPNLVYEAITKGLHIQEEREQLSKQIRERRKLEKNAEKEKEETRRDLIILGLSVFAVFSVVWDLCSIYKDAYTTKDDSQPAQILFPVAFAAIIILAIYIFIIKKDGKQ